MIDDPPADSQTAGVEDGVRGLDAATTALGLLRPMGAPPRAVAPPVAAPAVAAPSQTRQIRVVSALQMARLLHRVEPVYPPLARQTRISGTVELTGVIGTDGRIRELRVVSGHPFLAAAALEAVRQWVYEPTLLNGEPVEVIAPITVNFRLN
jgi:protein TonB